MRKKRTILEETLPDTPQNENLTGADDLLATLFKVYKINNGTKSFCFQTEEIVDEVSIQLQYPSGGKFVVVPLNADGVPLTTQTIDIEPKPTNPTNPPATSDIQTRLLMDELNFTRQMIFKMLEGRGTAQQTPIGELVGALQGMQSLAPAQTNAVDLIIKGMEMASKFNTGASPDWKSEAIHTLKEIASPVLETMAQLKANPTTTQQLPNPNGATKMIPTSFVLQQGIKWLKSKILANMEPGLAVDWLIQNANDAAYQPFISMAVNGDVNSFVEIDAEIANEPYKSWFETSIGMIKEAYGKSVDDSSNNDRGNGNGSDVAANEEIGSGKSHITKVV